MWPGEHEELTVWADARQAEGHVLGELVGLGLRAEQLAESDPQAAARLTAELDKAIAAEAVALLGPARHRTQLKFEWQLGVVRALTIDARPTRHGSDAMFELLTALFQRPAMRFLDHLHFERGVLQTDEEELRVLELLGHPAAIIRPRRLILGSMPATFRSLRPLVAEPPERRIPHLRFASRYVPLVTRLTEERGLTWLCRGSQALTLPWASGEANGRVRRLDQLLSEPWTTDHASLLGRALWDTSLRVRRRLIEAIPELPDAAAPLALALLAINVDGHKLFDDLVTRSLERVAERPSWVGAVAQNWSWREPWVATWLASVGPSARDEARRALPRMRRYVTTAYDARRWDVHARLHDAVEKLSAG